jgi:SWI/SNF-related matrix-associated actin-dependent regulator of chromatin subfamily A protein 2/4
MQEQINSEVRGQQQRRDPHLPFDVLITSYEIILRDMLFLRMLPIRLCVIDEAHRLKNAQSALVQTLKNDYCIPRWLLLTGSVAHI